MARPTEPVIISGGGPTGLVTALGLGLAGIPSIVLETEPSLPQDLRAGSFHPPTVEILAGVGVADAMHATGIKVPSWQIRDRIEGVVGEFDLSLLKDETPYPYRLHLEQHQLSALLLDRIRKAVPQFADVRFGHTVTTVTQGAEGCTVTLADGRTLRGSFVVACDGARSPVRRALNIPFEGFTWPERLAVASTRFDIGDYGFTSAGYIADPEHWAGVFRVPDEGPPGLWRIAYPVDADAPEAEILAPDEIRKRLAIIFEHTDLGPTRVDFPLKYSSSYRVHQRVAETFAVGRIAIAGDAAHLNNPIGALGLNGAIHDGANVTEKLKAIYLDGADHEAMLQLYDRQRRPINVKAVQAQSIRNKRLLEERNPDKRRAGLDHIRRTAGDPVLAKAYLMESSLINSIREAAAVK